MVFYIEVMMFWVVQNNLFKEEGFKTLIQTIERMKLPYKIVKAVSFVGDITPDINPENPVIAIGAYSLWKVAKRKGWKPGVFVNENFTFPKFVKNYGDNLLNKEAHLSTIEGFEPKYDEFFVKPCKDSKVFAGQKMTWEKFKEWRDKILDLGWEGTVTGNTCVVQAPVKEIYREYRFFVVNGKVITGSQYRVGTRVFSTECNEKDVIRYAQKMVNLWSPAAGFVMDVAITPDGFKVIEVNCLNASGFYACDMSKVVFALEELYN